MILLNSQMDLFYNLRNVCLVLFVIFLLISIVYGVKVHILTTAQKYFGIEKRREIAKRRADGYKQGVATARMRYIPSPGVRTSNQLQRRGIDVSQVRTEKMQQSMETIPLSAMEGTVPLSAMEGTVPLSAVAETTVLSSENQETVVLSQENQETVVLSSELQPVIRKLRDIVVVHGEDIE